MAESAKEAEARMQEKVMQAEFLRKQAESAGAQLELVMRTLTEMTITKEVLLEISKIPEKTETLVPLGTGVYLKAMVADREKVFVGLGAETVVEKKIPEAIGIIDEQIVKLEEARGKLNETVEQINETLKILVPELERIAAKFSGHTSHSVVGDDGFVRIP
ncbi:MAG: prefoldin subunit alpha [archaeon]